MLINTLIQGKYSEQQNKYSNSNNTLLGQQYNIKGNIPSK